MLDSRPERRGSQKLRFLTKYLVPTRRKGKKINFLGRIASWSELAITYYLLP